MQGARFYAELFGKTQQIGRLFLQVGEHARGKEFHIWVLPKDEPAIFNGPQNPPLNNNSIEVYGIISGQPGWTEVYGWKHFGPWEKDFANAVTSRREELESQKSKRFEDENKNKKDEESKKQALLADY